MATDTVTLPHIAHELNTQVERMRMMEELTRQAIESLPNSTDSDAPIAVLTGMRDMLGTDALKMCRLSEGVASLLKLEAPVAEQAPTLRSGSWNLAFEYLEDEHETLLALATTLVNRLQPQDPADPDDCADKTSWRLAQLLNERVESTEILNTMRALMLGNAQAQTTA